MAVSPFVHAITKVQNSISSSITAASLFASTRNELEAIEERIRSVLVSDAELLSEISSYLLALGGKRVRPLLVVLAARLFGLRELTPQLIDVAAGIELIHMATLLHDDIIDESPTRRHKESAFRRYGLSPSLLSGDFLLVRAFGLCARLDQFVVVETERACVELTEGEILEGHLSNENIPSIEDYVNIVGKKTSALFALATQVGAHLAQAPKADVSRMERFGYYAGIAFQMVDDILDVTADEDLLGKPVGTDLRQKSPSLVNVLWLGRGDERAREFFAQPGPAQESAEELVQIARGLRDDVALMSECRSHAEDYAHRALAELHSLSAEELERGTRRELQTIIEYTLNRCM